MRKMYISFLLSALCAFASCGNADEADNSVKNTTPFFFAESPSVNFGDRGGVAYFTVTTNRKFTAVTDKSAAWCSTSVIRAAESSNVEVVAEENPHAGKRTAKITVGCEGFTPVEVIVTQLGKAPGIIVKEKEVVIRKENPAFSLEITSNIKVVFELPEWIEQVGSTRTDEVNVYNFVAGELPETTFRRDGTITVKTADPENEKTPGELSVEIPVTQYGNEPFITVAEPLVTVVGAEYGFSFKVTANMEISFEMPEWIDAAAPEGTPSPDTYYFHTNQLPEAVNSRQGDIIIKANDPRIVVEPAKVSVRQVGDPSLEMPRFAVISDIHHGRSGSEAKVKRAIASLLGINPAIEAIFVVGDITEYGNAAHYEELLRVWKDPAVIPQDLPVYFMMGNHDHYTTGGAAEVLYKDKIGTAELHRYVEIKGHGFICVSQRGTSNKGDYGSEEINFIRNGIEKANASFPGKPVFVFVHVGVEDTCYGTETVFSPNWGTSQYKSALTGHPETILFSGHSHFPLGDPRSIHQGTFTAVNDGGTAYAEIEPGYGESIHPENYEEVTEAVIVAVKQNGDVELTRWDTYRSEEITPKWLVEAPHDGSRFKYTTALRKTGEAPLFAPGASVSVIGAGDFTCTVNFPAADDDQNVFMYDVRIYEAGSQTAVKSYTKFSGFYFNSKAPAGFSLDLDGLAPGTGYRVEVTATDSFLNRSLAIAGTFTTTDSRPEPVTDAPVADLLDFVFNDKGLYDRSSGQYSVTRSGTPVIAFNSAVNSYFASFSGSNSAFYKFDYENDAAFKNELSNGFTLETYYMTNSPESVHSPVSSQENGGFGFESEGGKMVYWIRHKTGETSSAWLKSASTDNIVSGTHYHLVATYSGTNAKLYVNGELQQSSAIDELVLGSTTAQWLCVGGDANIAERGVSQSPLDGNVVFVRMYKGEVSAGDISKLHQQIEYRKYVNQAQELATLLSATLPAKAAANSGLAARINATVAEGWEVMNNYASTESDFITIIDECNTY